jgi:hypothetical protein
VDAAPYVEAVTMNADLDGDGTYETALDGSANNGHFTATSVTLNNVDADENSLMDVDVEVTVTLDTDGDAGSETTTLSFSGESEVQLKFKQPQ